MFTWGQKMAPDRLTFFFFFFLNAINTIYLCVGKIKPKKKSCFEPKNEQTTDLILKVYIVVTHRCEVV